MCGGMSVFQLISQMTIDNGNSFMSSVEVLWSPEETQWTKFFFFFLWYWVWTQGLHLESLDQSFFVMFSFEIGSHKLVIQLSCSDTFLNDVVIYCSVVLLAVGSLTGILCSYCKIVSCIHAISSAQGKYKAFSTRASHLSVVSLFYCIGPGVYLSSTVTQDSHSIARALVMYSVVTPMLNPCIYSLRNKDIKSALKRLFW
jgi:hypothetical protein